MAEYIDKQAFLEKMKKTDRYFAVKFDIESFPAADVAPVVHGKWEIIRRHRGRLKRYKVVDETGETHTVTVDDLCEIDDPYCSECGVLNESIWRSFCPNCGAKMDGESGE